MSHLLNTSQHTSLAVVLRYFERSLRQAEMWLQGEESAGVLYRSSLRLSPERRAAALAHIPEALEGITRLAERFELPAVAESLASRIAAEMSVNWANLVDTRSAKLRRYGPVDPELYEVLDSEIEHLAQLAFLIASLVREGSEEVLGGLEESS